MRHDAANKKLCIQVNDGAVDEADYTAGVFAGASPFRVGAWANTSGAIVRLDGYLDEVAVWKNYIPSAAERTWLYNGGSLNPIPVPVITASATLEDDYDTGSLNVAGSVVYG